MGNGKSPKQSAHFFLEPSISLVCRNASLCGNGLTSALNNFLSKPLAVSHIIMNKTMDSNERGMSPDAITILGKNIGRARDRTSDFLFSSLHLYRLSKGGLAMTDSHGPS